MEAARAQLAEVGAAALSLRSIAREVGMVSSAVYRYVASRDELLTRLIVDAYDALGAAAEEAAAATAWESGDPSDADRWVATATAIRSWARAHPHEHLLLYGSPVPGYAAPGETTGPGTRATLALASIVGDAAATGRLAPPVPVALTVGLRAELDRLATIAELDVPAETIVAFLAAWTQLFGLLGFELTNQTRGFVADHAGLFEATARLGAHQIGLR